MFGLFRRKTEKIVVIPRDPPAGMYQGVWERKRQPSPGAQAYAWESLGLAPFTPIGASVTIRQGIRPLPAGPQPAVGLAVRLQGIPTTAGSIYGQPLFDPSANGQTTMPTPINNLPFYTGNQPFGGEIQ